MAELNKYDIIIIGAGLSGLAAGCYAAKEGKNVLILEKNNLPGGVATSFKRGRFEFDASLKTLGGFSEEASSSDLVRILKELRISDKIYWNKLQDAFKILTKTQSGTEIKITLPFGVEEFIEKIEGACPGSKKPLIKLFELADEIENAIKYIENIKNSPNISNIHEFKKKYSNFIRTAPYSVNEVLLSLEVPKKAREILTASWLNFGIDCDKLSFVYFINYLNSYIKYGSHIPNNRITDITAALQNFYEQNGGKIRFNSQVTRIKIKNNSVEGVVLKDGEKLLCKNIICTCSPTIAYGKMIKDKDLPISAIKRTNARALGGRAANIYIGLNKSAEELGITDYLTYISDINDTAKQFELMKNIETNNAFTVICPNVLNPNYSEKGTSILILNTFYSDNCWANIPPEHYFDEKDMLAARFIANFEERTGIIIHNNIEELEVATPVTFSRILGTPQGVTFGYYPDDWDGIIPRIMTEETDNDIKGLRFCGSWGTLLSGVSAAVTSGRNTLYATLNDLNEEA